MAAPLDCPTSMVMILENQMFDGMSIGSLPDHNIIPVQNIHSGPQISGTCAQDLTSTT
jgi:hypothetical protein